MATNTLGIRNFAERRAFIGGSDARIIMGDDEAALIRLWQEKRGEAEREDLSGNLVVQLGAATEELNALGTSATPADASPMFNAASSIQPFPGWWPPSTES